MIKIIIEFSKLLVALLLVVVLHSCGNFNGISGNGNVETTKRAVTESFSAIEAKTGLDVIIEQGNTTSILVEADQNLQNHIITKIENGVLIIYCDASIVNSTAQKVYVQVEDINAIKSSSGATVTTKNGITAPQLLLESSSGSEIDITVSSEELTCESSSGSEITVAGKATSVKTDASSGSEIDLSKLNAAIAKANASSGSSSYVNASETISANASSGSTIKYVGKPKQISIEESSGGSVKSK